MKDVVKVDFLYDRIRLEWFKSKQCHVVAYLIKGEIHYTATLPSLMQTGVDSLREPKKFPEIINKFRSSPTH